ncbi:16S rRNA (guanine(966)-N(2))-methyltransferase RsmD [Alphaproteobacteria bacterium]|nr:16S rRNA (guanine(966)-N(2))-methyltransferase RsmD [Alphaproteobacteria bacterium]
MRVISGKWGGTRLLAPKGRSTRPTTDRNREALFSMLGARLDFDGLNVLDAFAGSGALGLEALSRGAAHCTFIENEAAACAAIQQNIASCGAADMTTLLRRDARKVDFANSAFDLVLLDPPYGKALAETFCPNLAIPKGQALQAVGIGHHHRDIAPRRHMSKLRRRAQKRGVIGGCAR